METVIIAIAWFVFVVLGWLIAEALHVDARCHRPAQWDPHEIT